MNNTAKMTLADDGSMLTCVGQWTVKGMESGKLFSLSLNDVSNECIIDGSSIDKMDSAGAWELQTLLWKLHELGRKIHLHGFQAKHKELLELVGSKAGDISKAKTRRRTPNFLYTLGEATIQKLLLFIGYIDFIGELTLTGLYTLSHPKRIQFRSIFKTIDETGYQALPIIALLSFLIGVVLAYQMGLQLKVYGANSFIVQISGMAILREFAPLITAIIMAGRTTSSFTAQIGTMKVNEELDALRTMGLSPVNRLVLPKMVGTLIATPLLTVWSMLFGMLGSMMMSRYTLNISYYNFVNWFQTQVGLSNYVVGLIKTPVFALIIAGVGCFRAFQVQSSSDSVGKETTRSVVQAIFLIIIADAIFSLIFTWQGV